MAHTEVLLLQPVDGLGKEGENVKVRAGYARNFLLPRGYAIPLNYANRKQIEALNKARLLREEKERTVAEDTKEKLEKVRIAIAVKTGEGGKMFGAVTVHDLQQRLSEDGVEIEKRKFLLKSPIKTLGQHVVKIKLHVDVVVDFSFEVVSENPIETQE